MIRFSVDVHENGVVITPMGLGSGPSKVFEKEHIEDALLEIYHLCFNWKVGDRIKIVRKTTEDTDNAEAEIARLRALANECLDFIEQVPDDIRFWADYASEYHQVKHRLYAFIAKYEDFLTRNGR